MCEVYKGLVEKQRHASCNARVFRQPQLHPPLDFVSICMSYSTVTIGSAHIQGCGGLGEDLVRVGDGGGGGLGERRDMQATSRQAGAGCGMTHCNHCHIEVCSPCTSSTKALYSHCRASQINHNCLVRKCLLHSAAIAVYEKYRGFSRCMSMLAMQPFHPSACLSVLCRCTRRR